MTKIDTSKPAWFVFPIWLFYLAFSVTSLVGLLFYASGRTNAKPHVIATYQCSTKLNDPANVKSDVTVSCSDNSSYNGSGVLDDDSFNLVKNRLINHIEVPVNKIVSKHAKIRETDLKFEIAND